MVDNFDLIKSLLKFESKDDFYYLQIILRSKDNPDIGANNRLVPIVYVLLNISKARKRKLSKCVLYLKHVLIFI